MLHQNKSPNRGGPRRSGTACWPPRARADGRTRCPGRAGPGRGPFRPGALPEREPGRPVRPVPGRPATGRERPPARPRRGWFGLGAGEEGPPLNARSASGAVRGRGGDRLARPLGRCTAPYPCVASASHTGVPARPEHRSPRRRRLGRPREGLARVYKLGVGGGALNVPPVHDPGRSGRLREIGGDGGGAQVASATACTKCAAECAKCISRHGMREHARDVRNGFGLRGAAGETQHSACIAVSLSPSSNRFVHNRQVRVKEVQLQQCTINVMMKLPGKCKQRQACNVPKLSVRPLSSPFHLPSNKSFREMLFRGSTLITSCSPMRDVSVAISASAFL